MGRSSDDSPLRRISAEACLLGGAGYAVLLQIAHPLVAEGVAQHSAFESDPWLRLRRTLRTTLAIIFGDGPTAVAAVRRLNGVHAAIRGEVQDGVARGQGAERYRALDPALLLWVQVSLVWMSVEAYEAWVGPIGMAERNALWAEAREVGRHLGIPLEISPLDWPKTTRVPRTRVARTDRAKVARPTESSTRSQPRPPVASSAASAKSVSS